MKQNKTKRFAVYNKSDKLSDKILSTLLFPLRLFVYYFIFQVVLRIFFKIVHRFKFSKNGFKLPKGPYLLLGNHVSNCDGIYHNIFLKKFIYFIVHDELFKYKFSKILCYNLLGQIKRGASTGDISFLRKLTELRDAGKCIGIFPEGDISYIDKNLDIDLNIAKLAKVLNMPVVMVRIDGGRFRVPRWAKKNRFVKVQSSVTDVIGKDELKALSVKELHSRILTGISYDDQVYQRSAKNCIRSFNRAENLQNILYFCPDCNSFATLNSKADRVFCENCSFEVKYNLYGQFEAVRAQNVLSDIRVWDDWQKTLILDKVLHTIKNKTEIIRLTDVDYYRVGECEFFYKKSSHGTLSLDYNRLKFISDDNTIIEEYPLTNIKDLYIQFKGAPEFIYNGQKYRFISTKWQHYGYWFECFIIEILNKSQVIDEFLKNLDNSEDILVLQKKDYLRNIKNQTEIKQKKMEQSRDADSFIVADCKACEQELIKTTK